MRLTHYDERGPTTPSWRKGQSISKGPLALEMKRVTKVRDEESDQESRETNLQIMLWPECREKEECTVTAKGVRSPGTEYLVYCSTVDGSL